MPLTTQAPLPLPLIYPHPPLFFICPVPVHCHKAQANTLYQTPRSLAYIGVCLGQNIIYGKYQGGKADTLVIMVMRRGQIIMGKKIHSPRYKVL